jgi:hypothetical protein
MRLGRDTTVEIMEMLACQSAGWIRSLNLLNVRMYANLIGLANI